MSSRFQNLMLEAARLTRSGALDEATAAIGRALGGLPHGPAPASPSPPPWAPGSEPIRTPPGGSRGRHAHGAMSREFVLHLPPHGGRPQALLVMLHGCSQDADDFARGTAMPEAALAHGAAVLYPEQAADANPARCWNWFKHSHQQRGRGEAGLIASLVQALVQQHGIDGRRVFIAGLSAGGAMAAGIAAAHPELFAALGVHSGLAPGVAGNLNEALAAMRGDVRAQVPPVPLTVPTIVFHGDRDGTVHPANAQQLLAAAQAGHGGRGQVLVEQGVSAGGQRFTRSTHGVGAGRPWAEHWLLHGAGHAWAGGRADASYTDPGGPDASREMLRFFFSHAA